MSEGFELDLKKASAAGFVLDLSKDHPSLNLLKVRISWKEHPIHGRDLAHGFDLDVSAFFLDANGKVKAPQDVLFFNNQNVYGGAGVLPEDERAGGTEEAIFDLSKVPADRNQIDHFVNVFEAVERGQSFLMMTDAKLEFLNAETGELLKAFAVDGFGADNALHGASTVRQGKGWIVKPVGISASVTSLQDILKSYF